jgi:hypothetical protein
MSWVDLVRGLPRLGLAAAPSTAYVLADGPLVGDDLIASSVVTGVALVSQMT